MPARDLREWIDDLEERNDLKRITAEVHWDEDHEGDIEPVWTGIVVREHQRASPDPLPPAIYQRHRN